MFDLRGTYELRRGILRVGLPALVSRGTMAVWGILSILIIRVLPEDAYAVYAVTRSIEMFGVLLGGGFIQQALLKMASEGDGRREHELANAGILLSLAFALFSGALLIAGGGVLGRFYDSLDLTGIPLLIAGVVVSGTVSGIPRALLLSQHRTRDVMYSDILQFIVKGGVTGYLILQGRLTTSHQIFTVIIVANLCAFALSFALAKRFYFTGVSLRLRRVGQVLGFAVFSLGTAMANFIYTSTDIIMLGKLAPDDIAPYGAARSLAALAAMVNAAGNMVLLPLLSRMWSQGKWHLVVSRVWSSVLLAEIILVPAVIAFVFFPGQVMELVYSGKYSDGWPVLLILGALIVVRPLGSFFSTASLAVGKPQYSMYSVGISAVVNVSLNLLLIRPLGGTGAALATAAAVLLGTAWIVWKVLRHIREVSAGSSG